jgi:uncharacterized protein YdeI (YjbR/CyaY-like superfamily)
MAKSSALTAFATPAAFRSWLSRHHTTTVELELRLFKVHAAHRGITYAQALDEALCFGWIDGVRHGVDDDSFRTRFTPRQPRSIWSRVNIGHVERLMREGRMMPPGLAAFAARDEKRTALYSFENRPKSLDPALEKTFKANKDAWTFFGRQAPSYRRTVIFWIMSAKQEETRRRRLDALVDCCARGTIIPQLQRPVPKTPAAKTPAKKR